MVMMNNNIENGYMNESHLLFTFSSAQTEKKEKKTMLLPMKACIAMQKKRVFLINVNKRESIHSQQLTFSPIEALPLSLHI